MPSISRLLLAIPLLCAPVVAAAAPAPFRGASFAELQAYIADNGVTSLAELLPALPEPLRASFVLVRQTQSIQAPASPEQPRVILFGADARFVVAFNGAAKSLEVIEQPRGADHFVFGRVQFDEGGAPAFYVGDEAEKRFHCSTCHNGRPLWGQYREWAGVYGGDQEAIMAGSPEDRDYRAFLRSAKGDPLYKNLIFRCGGEGGAHGKATIPGHLRAEDRNDPSFPTCVESDAIAAQFTADPGRFGRRLFQPSEGLGEAFARLNAGRLFVAMKSRPAYAGLRHALLAVELGCAGDKAYIPSRRAHYNDRANRIDSRIRALHQAAHAGANRSIEHALLELLGIDIQGDIRLDVLQPNTPNARILGVDYATRSAYSPNPDGRKDATEYPNYNDVSDFTPDLLAFLVLRDLWPGDPELRAIFRAAVASKGRAPGYGEGLAAVLRRVEEKDLDPTLIPKYLDRTFFGPILEGAGRVVCEALTRRALASLPPPPAPPPPKSR